PSNPLLSVQPAGDLSMDWPAGDPTGVLSVHCRKLPLRSACCVGVKETFPMTRANASEAGLIKRKSALTAFGGVVRRASTRDSGEFNSSAVTRWTNVSPSVLTTLPLLSSHVTSQPGGTEVSLSNNCSNRKLISS